MTLSEKLYSNYVLVGAGGSGKSVLAVNLSIQLAQTSDLPVHLFDLDQTKAMFRSRDKKKLLEDNGVILHAIEQFYDAPAISIGVSSFLSDPSCIVILDVGGDERGAIQIGQFSDVYNTDFTVCLNVINPYRPWFTEDFAIRKSISRILNASRFDSCGIIANPNLGQETTAEDVIRGFFTLQKALWKQDKILACCLSRCFYEDVSKEVNVPLICLDHF